MITRLVWVGMAIACLKGMNKEIVFQGPRYRIVKDADGYTVVQTDNEGDQPITAKAIANCVSIKQAHFLATRGITKMG